MERTACDIIRPPPSEGDEFADYVYDLCRIEYFLYGFLIYHQNFLKPTASLAALSVADALARALSLPSATTLER